MIAPLGKPPKRRRSPFFWLKIFLPVTAIGLTAIVIIWSRLELAETRINVRDLNKVVDSTGTVKPPSNDIKVQDVVYDGKDKEGRPYHVVAKSATAQGKDYLLEKPEADLTLGEDKWAALKGDTGYYHAAEQLFDIRGNVILYRSDGTVFETEAAQLDIAAGTITGHMPVKGESDQMQIQAQGFELLQGGDLILFSGISHAIIKGSSPASEVKP